MNEIIFLVEDDIDGGYSARALGYPIFTQGEDEKELKINIRDAMECHFDKALDWQIVLKNCELHHD